MIDNGQWVINDKVVSRDFNNHGVSSTTDIIQTRKQFSIWMASKLQFPQKFEFDQL